MMSNHARQRCREMKISTKIAKRVVQTASLVTTASSWRGEAVYIATSTEHPDYVVTYADQGDGLPFIITTVLPRGEVYYRAEDGSTVVYRKVGEGDGCAHARRWDQACHACEDIYARSHPEVPVPARWVTERKCRFLSREDG
jgi:hypothetical protein